MIMTLFIIIDDTKNKREIEWDLEHSNWHHIKILQHLIKYFQYDMFGGQHSSKDILTVNKLKDIYKKNSNGKCEQFEKVRNFSTLSNKMKDISYDGFVIIHFSRDLMGDIKPYIHMNVSTTETNRDTIELNFKDTINEIGRFRKD